MEADYSSQLEYIQYYLKMKLIKISCLSSRKHNFFNQKKLDGGFRSIITFSFHIYSPCASVNCNLLQAMQSNNHKWIGHCKYHPDVNHLDISCCGQRLGYSHETITKGCHNKLNMLLNWSHHLFNVLTYYVVNTKSKVALTSITISRYVLLNVVTI